MNCAPPFCASTFVIAAVSVVLPWSTCPIVPTFTCGFERSNFSLPMATLPAVARPASCLRRVPRRGDWSPRPGLNWRPRPYQGRALPTELRGLVPRSDLTGAGNGIRTRDIQLGRLTLYQLSYSRKYFRFLPVPAPAWLDRMFALSGGGWLRTTEGVCRQIYSLLPLAAREPLQMSPLRRCFRTPRLFELAVGFEPATCCLQGSCSTS